MVAAATPAVKGSWSKKRLFISMFRLILELLFFGPANRAKRAGRAIKQIETMS
jgi:hypothetical protein